MSSRKRQISPPDSEATVSDSERDPAEVAAETLVAMSRETNNSNVVREYSPEETRAAWALMQLSLGTASPTQATAQTPADGDAQALTDRLEAAQALITLSRQEVNFTSDAASANAAQTLVEMARGIQRPRRPLNIASVQGSQLLTQIAQEAQRPETTATWTLLSLGRSDFFNETIVQNFSQAEVVAMRNRGEITEEDFLGAFGATRRGQANVLGALDPNRPNVLASTNLFPPSRRLTLAGRRRRRSSTTVPTIQPQTQAQAPSATDQSSSTAQPRQGKRKHDAAASNHANTEQDRPKKTRRTQAKASKDEKKKDDANDNEDDTSDAEKERGTLKPGPPNWSYLKTVTKSASGERQKHKYKPVGKARVTASDFLKRSFCRDVNRWYRQIHRRHNAGSVTRRRRWDPTEVAMANEVAQDTQYSSWEQRAREFNRRLRLLGQPPRSTIAMKTVAIKAKKDREAAASNQYGSQPTQQNAKRKIVIKLHLPQANKTAVEMEEEEEEEDEDDDEIFDGDNDDGDDSDDEESDGED